MDSLVFARLWVGLPSEGFLDLTPFDCVADRDLPEALQRKYPRCGAPWWEPTLGGWEVLTLNLDDDGRTLSPPYVLEQILVAECQSKPNARLLVQRLNESEHRGNKWVDLALQYVGLEPSTVAMLRFGHATKSRLSVDKYRDGSAKLSLARATNSPFHEAIDAELVEQILTVRGTLTERQQSLLKILESSNGPVTQQRIAETIGVSRSTIEKDVRVLRLLVKPLVMTSARGVELTDEGIRYLDRYSSSHS